MRFSVLKLKLCKTGHEPRSFTDDLPNLMAIFKLVHVKHGPILRRSCHSVPILITKHWPPKSRLQGCPVRCFPHGKIQLILWPSSSNLASASLCSGWVGFSAPFNSTISHKLFKAWCFGFGWPVLGSLSLFPLSFTQPQARQQLTKTGHLKHSTTNYYCVW